MHILIIPSERYIPKEDPLKGIFQQHQALALRRKNIKVGVVCPTPRSLRFFRPGINNVEYSMMVQDDLEIPVYGNKSWNWVTGRFPYLYQILWEYNGNILFNKYVKDHGLPDIVHAHNAVNAGVFTAKICEKHHIPMVLTEHSSRFGSGKISSQELPQIRYAFKTARARIMVSINLGRQVEKLIGPEALPWVWVPNVLGESFEKINPNRLVNPGNKPFHFLNVASLVEIKNHSLLIRAFAKAIKSSPNITLKIGGEGPLRHRLEQLTIELGVSDRVFFLGRLNREQVLNEMLDCGAFVLSSFYETFGVVLIEAAACGKPIIAISGSGPDCIINAQNGILVPSDDLEAMSNALHEIYSKTRNYDPLIIRDDCLSRFGAQRISTELIDIYKRVLMANPVSGAHEASLYPMR